jgi:hypothetical protein
MGVCGEKVREDLSAEVEESPFLETVTRERLVRTEKAGKNLAGDLRIVEISGDAAIACTYDLCF